MSDVKSTSDPPILTMLSEVLQMYVSISCSAHAKTKLHKEISELESKIVLPSNLKLSNFATAENIKQLTN